MALAYSCQQSIICVLNRSFACAYKRTDDLGPQIVQSFINTCALI